MRRILATSLAAALALTAAAAPARAEIDRDTAGRLLAGAVLLGIVGAIAHDRNRDDDNDPEPARRQPDRDESERGRHGHDDWRDDDWRDGRHGGDWRGRGARALPAACLREYGTRRGPVRLYDNDCLARATGIARHLPLGCAVTIRSHGRFESGFDPSCLARQGYRVAGH